MKRKPWLTVLLNIFEPGLGQLYCGRPLWGGVQLLVMVTVWNTAFAILVFLDMPPLNVIIPCVLVVSVWLYIIFNGVVTARRIGNNFSPRAYNKWYFYLLLIVVIWLASSQLYPFASNYDAYYFPTASMENTLFVGDYIIADRNAYEETDPEPSDLVVFLFPGDGETKYVKRCVAGPGDTVEVRNKALFVNGAEEAFARHIKFVDTTDDGEQNIQPRRDDGQDSRDNYGPFIVPPENYFVLGDNRDNSYDSRYWGPVPRELILARVVRIHWSRQFSRIGLSVR